MKLEVDVESKRIAEDENICVVCEEWKILHVKPPRSSCFVVEAHPSLDNSLSANIHRCMKTVVSPELEH